MKYFLALIISLMALPALAQYGYPSPGYDEAIRFCGGLRFPSERESCIQEARKMADFSVEALAVCKTLTFGSAAVGCLKAISGKIYSQAELSICRKETFDSNKVQCLSSMGFEDRRGSPSYPRPGPICSDIDSISLKVSRALQALRNGNSQRAMNILERLQAEL